MKAPPRRGHSQYRYCFIRELLKAWSFLIKIDPPLRTGSDSSFVSSETLAPGAATTPLPDVQLSSVQNEHFGHGPVTTCAFLRRVCPFSLGPPSLQLICDRVQSAVKYDNGRKKGTFGYCVGHEGDYNDGSEAR